MWYAHEGQPLREIRSISPYSVQMRKNTGQKNSEYGHFHAVNFKEKAVKLGFENSEITTLMHDISGKQIEDTVEKSLVDLLTNEEFVVCMEVLEQKWKNIREKGKQIYYYFKNNKLN